MHISDGLLPPEIWAGGLAVTATATVIAGRGFDERRIPQLGVLTSFFFVASLIPVPLGGTSVHLMFNGLLGIVLGWLSVPSVLVALFFQAILMGHGGLTTLGVNTVVIASGALASHALFSTLRRRTARGRSVAALGFVASVTATLVSALVFLAVMTGAGAEMANVARVALLVHIPLAIVEGLVTASTVGFLLKVKPELLATPGSAASLPT